jgi:hypothetical protein
MIFETDITFLQFDSDNKSFILGLNCSNIQISVTEEGTYYLVHGINNIGVGSINADNVNIISYGGRAMKDIKR